MPAHWAIDLGTTNTVAAMAEEGSVRVVHVPDLSRKLPAEQSPLIPSAVHLSEKVRPWLLFFRRTVREMHIGQPALDRNWDGQSPGYAQGFKRYLGSEPHRPMVRAGDQEVSAREIAGLFLQGLLAVLRRFSGARVTDLTIPAPVGFYEPYRAELQALVKRLGVRSFRSLDEPVAAALGYGVNVARDETLLVLDFGGGTLDLAAVRLGPHAARTGAAPVLAKHMLPLGGDDVDRWLVEHLVGPQLLHLPEWPQDVRWEAARVKELVSPEIFRGEFRWRGLRYPVTRDDLVRLLDGRGLYDQLRAALGEIQRELANEGMEVDEALLVGGSTLLPEVAAVVDNAFPDAVVRHDPAYVFQAVALGAARFASGVAVDDFIYHDYALAVQNEQTHAVEYELLIPRRTRYPTSSDFAVRYYADYPGMTEMRFSVCEVGRLGQAPVPWQERPNGTRTWAPPGEHERALVVALNPADPALPLRPAGRGSSPRLRVTYSVNADRWLCTTVEDLVRKQPLRVNELVVRLR
ncbi:MAG: Hsp70 family protein [Armatimonadetes bacterium]|nr:Hsp70 family protein [Armatimonadota bacterium]